MLNSSKEVIELLKRKTKMRTLIACISIYFFMIVGIISYTNISENSKTKIEDLSLTGKTVSQVEGILESEGYNARDYILITTDGSTPGQNWKIEKVRQANKKAQIFVEDTALPKLSSLNIVDAKWSYAYKKLQQFGYNQETDYQLVYDGTIINDSAWTVTGIDETDTKIPKIFIKQEIIEVSNNELEESGKNAIGESLAETIAELNKRGWTSQNYEFQSAHASEMIFVAKNWTVKYYSISGNKLILFAEKK